VLPETSHSILMRSIFSLWACMACLPSFAAETLVADAKAFDEAQKAAKPGDVIVLKNGTWVDAKLKIRASGTEELPVMVKAETSGQVLLSGDSRVQIGAKYVLLEGLKFENPTGDEALELRIDSDELAHGCRITQCAVVNTLPTVEGAKSSRFLSIYGSEHRIDHCSFEGKTTAGTTVVVWLGDEKEAHGAHRIDHNYFGPRQRLGKNGGETIRIGDSKTSMQNARCVVEHNVFEKCDGEAECISNKSCGNLYQRNTFREVSGTLTLRHGNRCIVKENAFLGNGAKGTGGIRLVGEDHQVIGNYLEKLRGDGVRTALCLMAGIPDSPENGYFQVRSAQIMHNLFVDCEHPIAFGYSEDKKATLMPENCTAGYNRYSTPKPANFPDNVGIRWNEAGIEKPAWASSPEPAGPSWKKP
jgi:poly(beta-D-mannuronate) lyase